MKFFNVLVRIKATVEMEKLFNKGKLFSSIGTTGVSRYIFANSEEEAIKKVEAKNKETLLENDICGKFCLWHNKKHPDVKQMIWITSEIMYSAMRGVKFVKDWCPMYIKDLKVEIGCIVELKHAEAAKHFTTEELLQE